MRKKVKQYIQKSLCGILSAAMILTSLSVPEMTAYAAQPGGTEIFEETSSEEVRRQRKSRKLLKVPQKRKKSLLKQKHAMKAALQRRRLSRERT